MSARPGGNRRRSALVVVVLAAAVAAWATPGAAQQAPAPTSTTGTPATSPPTTSAPPATTPPTVPPTTTPPPPPPPAGSPEAKLSPVLATLAQPSVQSRSAADQAQAVGLPASGPGSLALRPGGILVYVRVTDTAPETTDAVTAAGATVANVAPDYGVVTAAIPVEQLVAVADVPSVTSMQEVLTPKLAGLDTSARTTVHAGGRATRPRRIRMQVACAGATTSEGDTQLKAALARTSFGVDGSGLKIGVLSDSYDTDTTAATHAAQDIASGDLPGGANPCGKTTPVTNLDDSAGGADEGRAMLQVVHDLAPGAQLAFATAFSGEFGFAANIRALKTWGADIIVDDVGYFDEPYFQDGPVAVAVNDVTAAGAVYFSAAGNDDVTVAGKAVGSYEAPAYRPTPCPTAVATLGYADCHNFSTSGTANGWQFTMSTTVDLTADLQWNEPWYGVTDDLAVLLVNTTTGAVITRSTQTPLTPPQKPYAILGKKNAPATTNAELVVARAAGSTGTPRFKVNLLGSTGLSAFTPNTSAGGDILGPTIYGHSGTAGAGSVAAVPYNDSTTPEPYTSKGPLTHYYGPVVNTTAADPLGSPEVLAKPDLAATDGGRTTFFAQKISGVWRFYGTSEAAPHVAAIAALLKQWDPSLTNTQVMSRLEATAVPVANGTPTSVGAGLVDANAALGASPPVPAPMIAVVRGGDGGMWWQRITASTATAWAPRFGGLSSRPIVASDADGAHTWAFVRGNDGAGYFQRYTAAGSTWTGWIPLFGFLTSDPVVTVSNGKVWVVGIGGDNGVYWGTVNASDSTGATWSGWSRLFGAASANPAITPKGTGVVVVVRGTDGAPYWQEVTPTGGLGWQPFFGALQGSPAAVTEPSGNIDVFVRGTDNVLYRRRFTGTWTAGWTSLGGAWATSPAAAADPTGVSVELADGVGTPWVLRYNTSGAPVSSTTLGGATNADPSIATDGTDTTVYVRGGDFGGYWRRSRSSSWPGPWIGSGGWLTSAPAVALSK